MIPIKNHGCGEVKLEEEKQKRPPSKKLKHSVFLLTINTNKALDPHLEKQFTDFHDSFKCVVENLTTKSDNFHKVIKWKEEKDWSLIKDMEVKSHLEIGPKTGYLHSHSLIHIAHYSNIHLDGPAIQKFVNNELRYINDECCYVNIEHIPYRKADNPIENVLNYIEKSKYKAE